MTLICEARCGRGLVRRNNQDNLFVNGKWRTAHEDTVFCLSDTAEAKGLYAVCDGMGGEQFGEEAAELAAAGLQGITPDGFMTHGEEILTGINGEICRLMQQRQARIGSTFVGLAVAQDRCRIFNIGDSSAYLLRDGELTKLTCDHTRAQSLVNMGFITPEEAAVHPDRNKLTQHLGIFPEEMVIQPHVTEEPELRSGDLFLLCSDGLTGMVPLSELAEVLCADSPLAHRADRLYALAEAHGGRDNITLVLVSVCDDKTAYL